MILISNHLLRLHSIDIKAENVIRINIAWVKDEAELEKYLDIPYDVFIDYPDGRTKPPLTAISIDDTIAMIAKYGNIKYFAISNAESQDRIKSLRDKLDDRITLVPKIETEKGVNNIDAVLSASRTKYIMLDKEDLYVNVKQNSDKYTELISTLRKRCVEKGVHIFELSGVIFDDGDK